MKHTLFIYIIFIALLWSGLGHTKTTNESESMNADLKNDMAVAFGEKNAEQKAAAAAYAKWTAELQEHLVSSGDPFALAITLASRLSSVKTAKFMAQVQENDALSQQLNDLSYQPIADALNVMITQNVLTAESADILTAICFDDALKDYCHANVLLEKRMQLDQDNLQAYLRPFEIAKQAGNKLTLNKLLTLMTNSKHSKTVLSITPEVNAMIDEFINDNPVPQSYIDSLVADYEKLSGVSPSTKTKLAELMPDFMPTYVKASTRYLNDVPPYRTLQNYCKAYYVAAEQCREIAQIMIQKSNSMIDKGMGHAILIASYEAENNEAAAKAANALNDQFKTGYQCIQKLVNVKYPIDNSFDPEFQRIAMEATDEFEILIQQAEYLYRKRTAIGDESAVNPDSCFKGNLTAQ